VDGKQVACRQFPPGRKGGPEWQAAKEWEEEQLQIALSQKEAAPTLTGLERLLGWGDAYLAHVERTMTRQTKVEKETVMQAFFAFCRKEGINGLEDVTRPRVYKFLFDLAGEKKPEPCQCLPQKSSGSLELGHGLY
jgi:hypothetical protein